MVDVGVYLYIADKGLDVQLHASEHTIPHDLSVVGVRVGQVVDRYIVQFAVVDGQCERVSALGQTVVDEKVVWSHQTLLHLPDVAAVDSQPTAPHHPLEKQLQRLGCHLMGNVYIALIDGCANERVFASQSRQLWLLQHRLQRVRFADTGIVEGTWQHNFHGVTLFAILQKVHLPFSAEVNR